jgi:hypothetical protein
MNGRPGQSGLEYGPTRNGKRYQSLYIHRGLRPNKSQWSIPPDEEFRVFDDADAHEWCDAVGHYWGHKDGCDSILGTRGEKLAKFPANGNPNIPWHGFPVSRRLSGRDGDGPPDGFVNGWIAEGVVSKTIGRRIQKGAL